VRLKLHNQSRKPPGIAGRFVHSFLFLLFPCAKPASSVCQKHDIGSKQRQFKLPGAEHCGIREPAGQLKTDSTDHDDRENERRERRKDSQQEQESENRLYKGECRHNGIGWQGDRAAAKESPLQEPVIEENRSYRESQHEESGIRMPG